MIQDLSYYFLDKVDKADHFVDDNKDSAGKVDNNLLEAYTVSWISVIKGRQIHIEKMKSNRSMLYAYILSKISTKSEDK